MVSFTPLLYAPAPASPAGSRRRLCKNEAMTKYAVVIYEEPDGGFWAEVPALPGCYTQADTLPELLDNLREAIIGVLAVLKTAMG